MCSTDPEFAAKFKDIVGLYVDPPKHAVVLSVDEKSQIKALHRTQPGLPLRLGNAGTMTHGYLRNGVTTLFAAVDVLERIVLGRCMQRHPHQEFLRFLNTCRSGRQGDPRQRRHPQAPQGPALACPPSAPRLPLQADLGLLAERGRDLFLVGSSAAASTGSSACKPLSNATSPSTTMISSRSPGLQRPRT